MAALLLLAGAQAQERSTTSAERANDGVVVRLGTERIVIPTPLAEAVERAVREYADHPGALEQAIHAIISRRAGGANSTSLAAAVATFAILRAESNSALIAAIMRGAAQGNPKLSIETIFAALPALQGERNPEQVGERELIQAQATVENPSQVSPVQ